MISHGLSFVISSNRQVKTMDAASCHCLDSSVPVLPKKNSHTCRSRCPRRL